MYDPSATTPAQAQANFQGFGGGIDPLGYLARLRAQQQGQLPQNQPSAAIGTTGTDLAKIMQLLKQRQMLQSLQGGAPAQDWYSNAQQQDWPDNSSFGGA